MVLRDHVLAAAVALVFGAGCGARPAPEAGWPTPVARAGGQAFDGGAFDHGMASYYDDRLAGHVTAQGEPYDPGALTAAHRTLPFDSVVDVVRADGRHVAVRINDRGPFARGKIIDLSRRAADAIGMLRDGIAEVWLRVVYVPPRRQGRRARR